MQQRASNMAIHFPTWFRGLVIALAALVLCACQSTSQVAQRGPLPHEKQPQPMVAEMQPQPRPFPVEQASYASQQWVDQVPTTPYHGPVTPCPCSSCSGSSCAVVGPPDEYLCDGGDFGMPAGVRSDWSTEGVEQEDTISHYDTLDGRVVVKPSNRVCIYSPRFGAVRKVTNLSMNKHRVGPGGFIDEMALSGIGDTRGPATSLQRHGPVASLGDQPANIYRARQQAGQVGSRIVAMDLEGILSPEVDLQVVRLGIVDNAEKPQLAKAILSANTWSKDISAQVVIDSKGAQELKHQNQVGQVYVLDEPDSPRIRLIKLANCGSAQLGEEIEFTLRFDNVGDQTIGNVTIIDNLSTRFEFVDGSEKASVDADFVTEANEGGSKVLRWEIADPVKPGEGGVISFKVRIR